MDDPKVPVLHCPTCYSTSFQTSRTRPGDRLQLLILKFPVRCRRCSARMFASRAYVKWLRKEEQDRKIQAQAAGKPAEQSTISQC